MIVESIIPLDVVYIILQNLPVKSLLRFKSVCKSWNAIISDYEFTKTHHLQQLKNPDIFFWESNIGDPQHRLVQFKNAKFQVEATRGHPYESLSTVVLCSADVLALSGTEFFRKPCLLWNLRTKQHTKVSWPHNFYRSKTTFGFCRGPTLDDYKIVARCSGYYAVYSCKNKLWTEKKEFPFLNINHCRKGGLFVDGSSFWLMYGTNNYYTHGIFYFDPRYETFNKLQMPRKVEHIKRINLTSLNGCLCLYDNLYGGASELRIWKLRDNNVNDDSNSWSVFIIIYMSILNCMKPLFLIEKNKLLIGFDEQRKCGYGIYDLTEKRFEKIDTTDHFPPADSVIIPILDSLFFPA